MRRKGITGLLILSGIFTLLQGMFWLGVPLFLLGISVFLFGGLGIPGKMKHYKWLRALGTFFLVFVLAILFRVFFAEIFAIPSGSMEDTLVPGDKVLVNKLVYGPRLPASPYDIPWVNLVWYLKADAGTNIDSVYWRYRRLKGFSTVKRGDKSQRTTNGRSRTGQAALPGPDHSTSGIVTDDRQSGDYPCLELFHEPE